MTKFRGTKGKWILNGSRPYSRDGENHGAFDIVSDINTNVQIVGVPAYTFYGLNIETAEANAKLIACAPEMLEALKEMVRMYEKVQPAGGWQGVYEDALSVIKKATE